MFITPHRGRALDFEPGFHRASRTEPAVRIPMIDGTGSEVFVMLNFAEKLILLPAARTIPVKSKTIFPSSTTYCLRRTCCQCTAPLTSAKGRYGNLFRPVGHGQDRPCRRILPEPWWNDEHGWSDNGVFNFEGGCYAKAINLSQEAEPEIYSIACGSGTAPENVTLDPHTKFPNLMTIRSPKTPGRPTRWIISVPAKPALADSPKISSC